MKCELCHNHDAQTVIYRREADGSSRELYVCRTCADAERAFGGPRGVSVTAMEAPEPPPGAGNLPQQLLGKLESLLSRLPEGPEDGEGRVDVTDGGSKCCPSCGLSLDDLQNLSAVGCAKCYAFFGEALRTIVADLQGCRKYAGDPPAERQPGDGAGEGSREARLGALRKALKQAIEDEDYVNAKRFREELRKLEDEPPAKPPEGEEPHGA